MSWSRRCATASEIESQANPRRARRNWMRVNIRHAVNPGRARSGRQANQRVLREDSMSFLVRLVPMKGDIVEKP
jgi:hypothetical protein